MTTRTLARNVGWILGAMLLGTLTSLSLNAADLILKVAPQEAPSELDTSIKQALQGEAVQLTESGKPVLEFWLAKEIALPAKPDSPSQAVSSIKQTTLLGVVAVRQNRRDYKDSDLNTGIYTMRFGLQPQDGNHLGTAEYQYFAVLIPAKIDTKLDAITEYKAMVKASSKETSTDHPVILSLRPSSGDGADAPKLNEPAPEHKSIRVKIPAKAPGADKTSAVFELVYDGKGKS